MMSSTRLVLGSSVDSSLIRLNGFRLQTMPVLDLANWPASLWWLPLEDHTVRGSCDDSH